MYSVAVLEAAGGTVTSEIRDRLMAGRRGGLPMVFTRGDRLSAFSGKYDLFVVTDAGEEEDARNLRTRVLLAPGSTAQKTVAGISSDWVVSYGLSGKDSITLSSLEGGFAVLALQRELVTLGGKVVEQQEIPLAFSEGLDAQGLMAVYGSLLLLGEGPEGMCRHLEE